MSSEPQPPGATPWPGEYAGADEVPYVNWPLLFRTRVARMRGTDRYRVLVLVTALSGMFAVGFTITVLGVSISTIADDLGASDAALTWVVSGPLLAIALSMPLLGKVGDVRGHRRLYLIGFGCFTLFTGLCALAWSAPVLVALRVLAAVGGAATGPASMALVMQEYPPEDRVKALGWWSLVGAGAPVIGVVAGAPIVDAFGWRWIFVAQVPVSVGALLLAALVLHETPRRPRERLDVAGAVALGTTTLAALLVLDRGAAGGWTQPVVLVSAVVAPIALWWFVRVERRAEHPLLPLGLFAHRNFTAPLVAQFASNFAYMGGFIVTPMLMQEVFGSSLRTTGYVMLFRPLSFSLSAPVAGYLTVRVGERRAAVVGTSLVVVSMAMLAAAAVTESVGLVVAGLLASGLGLGTSQPSLVSSVANAVSERDLGVANGAQQTVAQIGVVAGIQMLSAIQEGNGAPGFRSAYLVGGAVAALGIVGAAFVRSAPRPVSDRSRGAPAADA